jgi:UDP-N-acetylmuramate dehydrogenase
MALGRFRDICKAKEPLAPYTHLRIGGPADYLVQPRSEEELALLLQECSAENIPVRVLGGGGNILVRDEGVRGVVLRLTEPVFSQLHVNGNRIEAGAGAGLSRLISEAAHHSLAGLELLVGIPGTVGGAVRCNAGDRIGEIGQYVASVVVVDSRGETATHEREELRFAYRSSSIDEVVILRAQFEMERDSAELIVKRMRKAWIQRKAAQPLTFQTSVRLFKDIRGMEVSSLIEQAGMSLTRVGETELSERDRNFLIAHPGATSADVLRLIDMIRSRVAELFGVDLELQISVW